MTRPNPRWKTPTILAPAAVALVMTAAACGPPRGGCTTATGCADGSMCVDGECHQVTLSSTSSSSGGAGSGTSMTGATSTGMGSSGAPGTSTGATSSGASPSGVRPSSSGGSTQSGSGGAVSGSGAAGSTSLAASSSGTPATSSPASSAGNASSSGSGTSGPAAGLTFAQRCAAPGVVRCVGFDAPADISGGYGDNSGTFPGDAVPELDTSVRASGGSSLRFTIPSQSGANTSGSYFTNFSPDLSVLFGENASFHIQWRQRFSPEFLETQYAEGYGWKQAIIGTGDVPGGGFVASCTDLEVVTQNTYQRGLAQMYNSCSGSTSHGAYDAFEEPFGGSDFKLQNARPDPYCLYSQDGAGRFPPLGNCLGYFPNEWMTFAVHIQTGPRVGDEFVNSRVQLFIGREGQPLQPALDFGPYNLSAGPASENQRFGKVWLLPYHTNKSNAQVHPVGYTWYDELIISTQPIGDPAAGNGGVDGGMGGLDAGSPPDAASATPDAGTVVVDAGARDAGEVGATALGQLVASMPAGSWAPVPAANQSAVLGVGSISGTMTHYCNKVPYNPFTHQVEIIGMDHNWGMLRYAQFDVLNSRFVEVSPDLGFGTATRHGYDHTTVNPFTGDVYHRPAAMGSSGILVTRKPLASVSTFEDLARFPAQYEQIAIATAWWSGSFVGAGAQGALVVFNSGDAFGNEMDGQVAAYDPLTGQWFFNQHGMAPFYASNGSTYHSVMDYSPQHNVAVFGGGNDASRRLWRLNADGTSTPMPDVPPGKGVGVQSGNLVVNPVNGNFLLLSGGELWELNPTGAGSWSQQTGSRAPPAGVGHPGPGNPEGVISSAITDLGVVLYVEQTSSTSGSLYVYKP